ncbi:CBO0543 family protein [Paenibacillus sp. SYP-B3998]|uniref:CBO0543 family protein n=1 Tax=Paenibacillus sp. SYP-B3998 TaxID=2678564 RepID=UPI001967D95C|nr:CBO0543 family protein [Paenibacillus sp. SYP-B3998]
MDRILLIAVWAISITGLLLIPKRWRREAQVVFLFQQFINWILGLLVVQNGWIEYPLRELVYNRTSFTFEFMAYPIVAVYMNLYYPIQKSVWIKLMYVAAYPAGLTAIEHFIEKKTPLIDYITWKWYWTFLSVWVTLYLSRWFYTWFFRKAVVSENY